jgi:hypothetical protein
LFQNRHHHHLSSRSINGLSTGGVGSIPAQRMLVLEKYPASICALIQYWWMFFRLAANCGHSILVKSCFPCIGEVTAGRLPSTYVHPEINTNNTFLWQATSLITRYKRLQRFITYSTGNILLVPRFT